MNFRKRAEMFTPRPAQPLLPHCWVDNTMPERDWSVFDERAVKTTNPIRLRLRRQANVAHLRIARARNG